MLLVTKSCLYADSDGMTKTLEDFIVNLQDPRKAAILAFHEENLELINISLGSSGNHQYWEGGYRDHLTQTMQIAEVLYSTLPDLPFSFASVIVVLIFHDVEKIWKYTTGFRIDKEVYLEDLTLHRGIAFTDEEKNALKFVHGENDVYEKHRRVMNPLAAFCHMCDVASARIYFGHRGTLRITVKNEQGLHNY
jgi:hypothetical protein